MLSTSSNFRALLDLIGASATVVHSGTGSPEGSEIGTIGDIYARVDGGPGNSLYLKVAGTGLNTGWVPAGPPVEDDLTAQTTPPTNIFTLNGGAKAFHDPSIGIVVEVFLNGQRQTLGGSADYTVSESGGPGTGFDTFTFTFTPRAGDRLFVLFLPL